MEFDLWVQQWRRRKAVGEVIAVRYADDSVMGFQYKGEAKRFLAAMRERFAQFGLALHPDKTRLLRFERHALRQRQERGEASRKHSISSALRTVVARTVPVASS